VSDPFATAAMAAAVAVGSTLLTIFVTQRIQNHFWKRQRTDELRLAAINEFNRLANVYTACLVPNEPRPPLSEWLRDLNIAADTICVLFSDATYQAAKQVSDIVTPYAAWDALSGADKKKRADKFSDACHEALTALYGEVLPLKKSTGASR
jgi:hypothetical protein